jgi:hypothetical protein
MRIIPGLLATVAIAVAAPATAGARAERGEARLAAEIEGHVAGPPVSCIDTRDISSTEVIEGAAIIYRTPFSKFYVNRPEAGQNSLRRGDMLVTRNWKPELCNIDVVRLVDSGARMEHGTVFLGDFVPYTKVDSPH